MASLYEIDSAILDCVDIETGEILDFDRLSALRVERGRKIESVACWYKNLVSDADALKAEKNALAEREKAARNKAESLKKWLSDALNGEKLTTSRVDISFRKSEAVEIDDEAKFIEWAQRSNLDDLLSYKEPTPNKTAIKYAIRDGRKIEGAQLVERQNMNIK